ncbi:Two component regulator three Y domain-containing protein [Sediminibacillus dalangtanensis]|uniref:Two component regulator three Y domain-containing protein n=1 Tax=Sediminibacillus dalangtanensis TaxID=2729421 RepID=A0ABX7VVQ3_9BACI|nr:Two component regulator three Y domain-containing protein [Sediminibacillus dalangtanensis]QTN00772.1 Two component regulator three Y domain-containing protein [Sediminibacillus dalangtanensis]
MSVLKGEKIFNAEKSVKYFFQKSYKKTNHLVIVFSAFSPIGKPPKYNYISTLEGFDCNKLFILDDFGSRASYYLCQNRDFLIERSVYKLIQWIIKENNIENVMACGSSKGGYAALYYGIKYGFDHIIVASPQYYLGDYLLDQTNSIDVVDFLSGSSNEEDKKFLNNIMYVMISETNNRPNIFIHLGKGETHYQNHVQPLLTQFEKFHFNYELDLGNYSDHKDVALFYPEILKRKVRNVYGYPLIKFKKLVEGNIPQNTKVTFEVETDGEDNKVAWYLYLDGKKIDVKNYTLDRTYEVMFAKKGQYKVRSFVINKEGFKISATTNKIVVE